jgi:uncharacterized protein YjbI with pentapeptide repeats
VANEKLVAALKAGGERWDRFVLQYKTEFPDKPFDISDVDLRGLNLSSVTFPVRARFDGSHFKDAEFVGTVFEQGASFVGATFEGNTRINLNRGKGDLSFDGAIFQGHVAIKAIAGFKIVRFVGAQFMEGLSAAGRDGDNLLSWPSTDFTQAIVHGNLKLDHCEFRVLDFRMARLALPLEGMKENVCRASFRNSIFRSGAIFESTDFRNIASFENAEFLGSSSFIGAVFHRAPNFHDATLHQGTRFSSKSEFPALFRDTTTSGAAEAYRTLKLAMNKQHALNEELGFFLLEMRSTANRLPKWRQVPYRIYDLLSTYGQSVIKPMLWFFGIHLIFGVIYSLLSGQRWETIDPRLTSLTLYGAVPFASALRWLETGESQGDVLFSDDRLALVQIAVCMQSIVSTVLLFLIALGLRNMFKVR